MKRLLLVLLSGIIVAPSSFVLAADTMGATAQSSAVPKASVKDAATAAATKTCASSGSLTDAYSAIATAHSTILAQMGTCGNSTKGTVDGMRTSHVEKYKTTQESCNSYEGKANVICIEKCNPKMATLMTVIQAATSALGSGVSDACSTFAKAMKIANAGLLAYQTTCAASKYLCQSTCDNGLTLLKGYQSAMQSAVKAAEAENAKMMINAASAAKYESCNTAMEGAMKNIDSAVGQETNAGEPNSFAGKSSGCGSYDAQIAAAVVGGIGVLTSMGQANSCDEETSTTSTAIDCTTDYNKTYNMTCICAAAPRTAGCSSGLDTTLATKAGTTLGGSDLGTYNPTAAGTADSSTAGDGFTKAATDTSAASSLPGASSGGGAGGLDGGGLGAGGADKAAAKAGTGLNANILGGEAGGGGGGGGFGSGGGGADPTLRQYLPGGAKDPKAGMAGAQVNKDVTSPGGKSNWEKVRDRYRDSKPTLLEY